MVAGEGPSAGASGGHRNLRIEELRARIERLRERITEAQAEQRRAVMELAELLEETRRMYRRAQREQRASRWQQGHPEAAEPSESESVAAGSLPETDDAAEDDDE